MACEKSKFVGRDVVLEYVIGCNDALPAEGDWKVFGSMRTKEFNLEWETADATDADSIGSLRENLATFQSLTISGDGTVKSSGVGASNLIELTKHVANPIATSGQPFVWMRMTFPDLTFTAFMLLTTMSRSAPYDDVATYSMSATAAPSEFGLIVEDTVLVPASIIVSPNPANIAIDGGTRQMFAAVSPSGAEQGVTWTSGTTATATVNSSTGLVTAIANGTTVITATSVEVPAVTGTRTVTVTNQT
jgi:predicted secreted protein